MARVTLKNVFKKFGDVEVVKDLSLEIADEEFCIVVGPSGCGKTTTLRMIAGLEELTQGEIYIGDKKINDLPPKDRDIAMVFQNYALYPHMTVYENMAFGLKLRKHPKKDIEVRVRDAAEILGIERLLERRPKQLSGGQRQRVAVGRAIVRKPKVFLFDEPLSNLDAKLRVQMRAELKKLHERLKSTMIYVTHDQIEAMTMGDKICVMKDGVLQQVDNPLSLYEQPKNKFVAGFIGSPPMNFAEVLVEKRGDDLYVNEGSFALKIPKSFGSRVAPYVGKNLSFGVRPEDFYDESTYTIGSKDGNVFSSRVDVVEPLGSEIFLHISTDKNTFVAKVDAHNKAKTNDKMNIAINMNSMHLFEPDSGLVVI